MSWAEIKKAVNSNIDVPLDTRMSCGLVKVLADGGANVSPSLNIQGKGIINHIWYRTSVPINTTTPRLKITVDDNVIFDKCVKNQNQSSSAEDVRLGFVSSVFAVANTPTVVGKSVRYSGGYTYPIEAAFNRDTVTVSMSSSPETYLLRTDVTNNYYFIVADKPLAFNKNLKIETIGTTTQDSYYYIRYELYE